jgi:hypothetical protein
MTMTTGIVCVLALYGLGCLCYRAVAAWARRSRRKAFTGSWRKR